MFGSKKIQRRHSLFRHVEGRLCKKELFVTEVRCTRPLDSSNGIAANAKFMAYPWEGAGGRVAVLPADYVGKVLPTQACLETSSTVHDLKFSPFNPNEIALGTEDGNVRIFHIPEDGLEDTLAEAKRTLEGHSRRVGVVEYHPLASNVLVSCGADYSPVLWDVEKGAEMMRVDESLKAIVSAASFSTDGKLLAVTGKDKMLHVYDPRAKSQAASVKAQEGAKALRCAFTSDTQVLTTGFNLSSERQISLWDVRNLSESPVKMFVDVVDSGTGILMPIVDADTKMTYLPSRGDATIYFAESFAEDPHCEVLGMYQSGATQIVGIAALPKSVLDVRDCEVMRFKKLSLDSTIETISFHVPRKEDEKEYFQDDIYPDTVSAEPAVSADEWFRGTSGAARRVSLQPKGMSRASVHVVRSTEVQSTRHLILQEGKTGDPAEDTLNSFSDKMSLYRDKEDPVPDAQGEGVDEDEWDDY